MNKSFLNDSYEIQCPHCESVQDYSDCPDLFYSDRNNSKEINNQVKLLLELNNIGYNIVTCGNCGQVFIVKLEDN